jgi:hypothetical protein
MESKEADMKIKNCFSALIALVLILGRAGLAPAQCPQDTIDSGVCDTMYVEVYPGDENFLYFPGPWLVRFPIYVTNDIVDPTTDSIAGFVIPLCYDVEPFGAVAYCSLGYHWNNTSLYPSTEIDRSVFRHFIEHGDTVIHNRMMDMSQAWDGHSGREWDFIVLDLGNEVSHFWFTAVPTGTMDQKWWEGSRTLLATMTFKVNMQDSMRLCIDSCFWPPASRLAFSNSRAETYVPRHLLPVCQNVGWHPWIPAMMYCPGNSLHYNNGHFISGELTIEYPAGVIMSLDVTFFGEGVENVRLIDVSGLGTSYVTADVDYYVTDHCQAGGTVTVTMGDEYGYHESCDFDIILGNDPPHVSAPDTFTTLSDYGTVGFWVSAVDPNADSIVSFTMDGFWCQSDSLRAPTYAPTFDGNNPGKFLWNPLEADTGNWIALFSAEDICGAVDVEDVVVRVSNVLCGDATDDGAANVGDAVYLLNYLFKAGDPPEPLCKGNVNCDAVVDLADAIYILNRLFKHGPPCCFDCCTGW